MRDGIRELKYYYKVNPRESAGDLRDEGVAEADVGTNRR